MCVCVSGVNNNVAPGFVVVAVMVPAGSLIAHFHSSDEENIFLLHVPKNESICVKYTIFEHFHNQSSSLTTKSPEIAGGN